MFESIRVVFVVINDQLCMSTPLFLPCMLVFFVICLLNLAISVGTMLMAAQYSMNFCPKMG